MTGCGFPYPVGFVFSAGRCRLMREFRAGERLRTGKTRGSAAGKEKIFDFFCEKYWNPDGNML